MKYFIDPKTKKESVSLTAFMISFILVSVILVASTILTFLTKQVEATTFWAIGGVSITYMSACATLYFGRRKKDIPENLQEIIKLVKKEVE